MHVRLFSKMLSLRERKGKKIGAEKTFFMLCCIICFFSFFFCVTGDIICNTGKIRSIILTPSSNFLNCYQIP